MRTKTAGIAAAMIAGLCFAASAHAASISIYQSGFNSDEVFGAGDDPNNSGNSAVTADVDGSTSYWTGAGYNDGTNTASPGLPTGPFVSATGSGVTYQLQSFSGTNNALRYAGGGSTGTVSVTSGQYASLDILGTGGGGSGNSDITLLFSDSSTDTIAGGLVAGDWGNGGNVAISAQRTRPGSSIGSISTGSTWNIFESIVTLSPADQGKTLTGITFTNTGGGTANVYAVNGVAVPEPASLGLLGLASFGLLSRRRIAVKLL